MRRTINADRAIAMANRGLGYAEIGIRLAQEDGRKMPYTAGAVGLVIRRSDRAQ